MSKIITIPSKIDIKDFENYTDAYLFGIKNFSVNLPFEISLEELKEIKTNKEIFVALNKNIYSSELDSLKEILIELSKLNIKGIFFADTAVLNIVKSLKLNIPLVWSQEHLTTNYVTINNWYQMGSEYVYISSDITLREIKKIKEKALAKLIVPILGYIPIFTSKRHEVKNYLDHFNLKDNSKINYIEKEDKIYPITDNNEGTVVYSNCILNGYKEYKNLDVEYVTLNSFNIDEEEFIKILKTFKEKKQEDLIIENSDKGFLYKETIYKVK